MNNTNSNIVRLLRSPWMWLSFLKWVCAKGFLSRSPSISYFGGVKAGGFVGFSEYLLWRKGIPDEETRIVAACFKLLPLHFRDTSVDVGANIGLFSLALANSGFLEVQAFEPIPATYERLVENKRRNQKLGKRIRTINCGVGRKSGLLPFVVHPNSPGQNKMLVEPLQKPIRELIECPVVTLDEHFAAFPDAKVGFMKIDVEGFEPDVIRGASGLFRSRKIAFLYCEVIHEALLEAGSNTIELEQLLMENEMVPVKLTDLMKGSLSRCTFSNALNSAKVSRNLLFANESLLIS